jgi:hypothetical protein
MSPTCMQTERAPVRNSRRAIGSLITTLRGPVRSSRPATDPRVGIQCFEVSGRNGVAKRLPCRIMGRGALELMPYIAIAAGGSWLVARPTLQAPALLP